MYGSKAFEAMELIDEEQIKEYLPLTCLDSDDEKDPDWVREYKRFLRKNDIDLKAHMRNKKNKFNLTKEIEETKQKKWLLRQKFKLVSKLRKHGGYQKHSRMINYDRMGKDSTMPYITLKERSKSNMDNWNNIENNINISTNMIDESISTGPDVLSMLAQLK